jgi:hypothetical protein
MPSSRASLIRLERAAEELLAEAAPCPVRVRVEMADIPLDAFAHYVSEFGGYSTRLLPDGLACDVISSQIGAIHVELATSPRPATAEERKRFQLHLVAAAVGTERPQ